jgi:two-component system response regulator PilR (NtrC family)
VARVLVIDDEKSMREFLAIMLEKEGYEVDTAENGPKALDLCKEELYDLVITDIKMPRMDGLEVLHRLKEIAQETAVIMITAYASTETAVQAMKEGAYDYITKPFHVDEIKMIIQNALEKRDLERENILLRKEVQSRYGFGNIIGQSPEMKKVYDLIQRIAPSKANVLITGESGTGKELVAKAIHYNSPRKDHPIVTINCGGLPETLLESELFGFKKGAFTGATSNKPGLLETAEKGTIFLDEIGDLPLSLQVKLLRVTQDMRFKRIGGTGDIEVDVRLISATNKELEEEVIQGSFREDLYYRLNVIHIHLPPLRERKEDIPLLAQHFLEKYSKESGKEIGQISSYAIEALMDYGLPGNVRELENIIQRSVTLETSNIILPESLALSSFKEKKRMEEGLRIELANGGIDLDKLMGKVEKDLILQALKGANGVKKRAAKILGISFDSLRYRLEKLGLKDGEW